MVRALHVDYLGYGSLQNVPVGITFVSVRRSKASMFI